MKLQLTAIFLSFVTLLAIACPPPFNNFNLVKNDTRLRKIIDKIQQLGNEERADFIPGVLPHHPWPFRDISGDKVALVLYCYQNEAAREKFAKVVDLGWSLWLETIGKYAEVRGHSLLWAEVNMGEDVVYCRDKGDDNTWNSMLPSEVVEIRLMDDGSHSNIVASSTVEFIPPKWDSTPGRHALKINDFKNGSQPDQVVPDIAHELGHIFGLSHEHQRVDRDLYIHFNCTNIANYTDVKARVERDGDYTMDQVCASAYVGYLYGFTAPQYSTKPEWLPESKEQHNYARIGKDYDDHSIMQYDSGDQEVEVGKAILTRWVSPGPSVAGQRPNDRNSRVIRRNTKVTALDAEMIKMLYPWQSKIHARVEQEL